MNSEQHDAIEISAGGLKCDAPPCDFVDHTVTMESYPDWLDRPCPKCGANLLTQADFDAVQAIIAGVRWVNTLVGPCEGAVMAAPISATINFDGGGIPKVNLRSAGVD